MSTEAEKPKNTSESSSEGAELEDVEETSLQTTGESSSNPDGEGSENTDLSVQAAPGAVDFKHPLLAGKTPEEIERIVATQEAALREQNDELNRLHSSSSQAAAPAPKQEEEEEDPYGDDFLAPRFRKLEDRLGRSLERMVEPLVQQTRTTSAQSVREQLRQKHRHFTVLEPHIDKLLRDQGLDPTTAKEGQLTMIYHTAVGLAAEQGINLEQQSAPTPTKEMPPTPEPSNEGKPPVNIPQHRPSSAPLPPQNTGGTPKRPLTESERRLAREYFPNSNDPEGEYRALQDAHEDEVVAPGFSKENW